jgi:hypothetical protein
MYTASTVRAPSMHRAAADSRHRRLIIDLDRPRLVRRGLDPQSDQPRLPTAAQPHPRRCPALHPESDRYPAVQRDAEHGPRFHAPDGVGDEVHGVNGLDVTFGGGRCQIRARQLPGNSLDRQGLAIDAFRAGEHADVARAGAITPLTRTRLPRVTT